LVFILILPIFGKGIDYQESLLFYGVPVFFAIKLLVTPDIHPILLPSKYQYLLIVLYLLSVVFSVSIGTSYYSLMNFMTVILILNLAPNFLSQDSTIKNGLVFASVIYSLVAVIYKFFLPTLFPVEFSDNVFVQNWGHSYIADFLIFSVPIIIATVSSKKNFFSLILLIPIFLAIATANSRSSIVALIIGILLLKSQNKIQQTIKIVAVFSFLISLVYIFFFSNYLKSPNGSRPEYWSQAISGFIHAPLVGVGPGNFGIINRLYRHDIQNSSNYAHNSILESLSGNGIFFTVFAFSLIGYGLYYQYHHRYPFFVLGVITLVNSLLDASWSSPGILTLSLIFIFWKISLSSPSKKFLLFLTSIVFLYLVSKTTSDVLFSEGKYDLSLLSDPFNPGSLGQLIDTRQPQIRQLYRQDPGFLNLLTNIKYLPANAADFYLNIRLDPKGSVNQITRLTYFYNRTNNFEKLKQTIPLVYSNLNPISIPFNLSMEIAKSIYKLGLYEWEQKDYETALFHFQKAVIFAHRWSHFQLELASALWHSNRHSQAYEWLTTCQKNTASARHCHQFELDRLTNPWPTPGSFSQTIYTLHFPTNGQATFLPQTQ